MLSAWTKTRKEGRSVVVFVELVCAGRRDKKTRVSAGMLPGAGDGAHSISVAAAPGNTAHLTSVTVHLPHKH